MTREIKNQRTLDAARQLPGRENPTDQSRGYVGWGPYEDAMVGGKVLVHETWQDMLGAIQTPAREIHDFYFGHDVPSAKCACCDGSGKNKDFAELQDGFQRRIGRWPKWGDRLTQQEVDVLFERGYFHGKKAGEVTPANYRKHLSLGIFDASAEWKLVPVRAKALGISTVDCYDCVGTGLIQNDDARIKLHAWTFDVSAGTSRVDTVTNIKLDELEEVGDYLNDIGWQGVKRRFGWAVSDNQYPEIVYEKDWQTFDDRNVALSGKPSFWGEDGSFASWKSFSANYSCDDMNLPFDYKIVAAESQRDEFFEGSALPETFGLRMWMTHPRKGTDVIVTIRSVHPEDAAEIKGFLRSAFEIHGRHFAWAAGREFGNEIAAEESDIDEQDSMSMFLPRR